MTDFFEVDFLPVSSGKSGDAIAVRYRLNGSTHIHVVDGGFQGTGSDVVAHIRKYYEDPTYIDHVVATHPDGDHAGGLRSVLEEFSVGQLWMLRPWEYADQLIHRFTTYSSADRLRSRLRSIYPNIAALEAIALERGIPIREPVQGQQIGAFLVLAPRMERYLDMVVESDRTPESETRAREEGVFAGLLAEARKGIAYLRAAWGEEVFSPEDTSAENEMSVVQLAALCGKRILLTADAGRAALMEAADHAEACGFVLPGIDKFQVPHHGSRRNVNTEILDRWLGPRQATQGESAFTAIVSASKEDEHHPRKAVVRACIHRHGSVFTTETGALHSFRNAPDRGWKPATALPYPDDQEE